METIEALIHRRSCRKYSDRPVEAEKLARIIEAGQYAPSGMGRQPVTFVAVTDPATVERLSQLNAQVMDSNSDPFYGAKTVVVVLVDRSVPTHLEDGSLAMGNLLNAAYALGVDTAEYAIPGLDDDFRVIVSPWILSVLTTDRLSRNYELVTKHNLKYRRYYHQFDY